ncbi:MAG: ABC transporter permease [bacterium]|nr:ABC transporter permease [bacterium]
MGSKEDEITITNAKEGTMEPDGLEVSSKPAMLAASGPQSSACPSDSPGQEQSCQSGSGSTSKSAPTPIKPVKQLDKRLIGVLLVAPFVLYICTFFLLPLISVVSMSTHSINDDYMLTNIRTLSNFRSVVNAENLPVLLRSAKYALCTTCLCLFLGYPLAWYIARYGGRYKPVLLILVMLPFWTSYLIRIFAWMTILQTEGLLNTLLLNIGLISQPLDMLNTPFSVILGLTYGFLPFAILPLYVSLEKLDDSLMEAAADLGAPPCEAFTKVVLPLSLPGVISACLLTFVPAMGDFVTPEILGGVDTMMIGNLIQQQYLGFFNWPLGSALSLVLMGLMLCSILVFLKMSNSMESLA